MVSAAAALLEPSTSPGYCPFVQHCLAARDFRASSVLLEGERSEDIHTFLLVRLRSLLGDLQKPPGCGPGHPAGCLLELGSEQIDPKGAWQPQPFQDLG